MKYLVLLRGINVGGNNIIKMSDLKKCLEDAGFKNVKTYIQSGNVILDSPEKDREKLTSKIEKLLSKEFNYKSKVVLRTHTELKKIIEEAPKWWDNNPKWRHYLIFVKEPMTSIQALKEAGVAKADIEKVQAGSGVIYLSGLIKALTRTNYVKLPSKPIYQHMTIRNYNTTVKLLELMEPNF